MTRLKRPLLGLFLLGALASCVASDATTGSGDAVLPAGVVADEAGDAPLVREPLRQ